MRDNKIYVMACFFVSIAMPKKFELNELLKTLSESKTQLSLPMAASSAEGITDITYIPPKKSDHHFLFFMGTNNKFQEKPEPLVSTTDLPDYYKPYPRGETFSFLAQSITALLNEKAEIVTDRHPSYAYQSYTSSSVDLVDGPDSLGKYIGDRIARGVFISLMAAANGKKTLQLAGFSRGGVECIIIMHELERIKLALKETPRKKFKDIICDSASPEDSSTRKQTLAAFIELFGKELIKEPGQDILDLLSFRLEELKIHAFLVDPVPGGNKPTEYIGWKDPLFHKKMPCESYNVIICRNENSHYFTPIIPSDTDVFFILGSHGSPMGNPYTQTVQKLPAPYSHKQIEGSQDLTILKFLNFVNDNTGIFNQSLSGELSLAPEHQALNCLLSDFICHPEKRDNKLFETFETMFTNRAAFESLTKYSLVPFHSTKHKREVFNAADTPIDLDEIAPLKTSRFLSNEHALAYINKLTGFTTAVNATYDYDAMMNKISNALDQIISEMKDKTPNGRIDDISTIIVQKFKDILNEDKSREIFFQALSTLINSISQRFLCNNISVLEKENLLVWMSLQFNKLSSAIASTFIFEVDKKILKRCQIILQSGIKQTLETHYQSIISHSKHLLQKTMLFLDSPEEFIIAFESFCEAFVNDDGGGGGEQNTWSREIIDKLSKFKPKTIEALTIEFNNILWTIESLDLTKSEFTKHKLFIELYKKHLQAYFDVSKTTTEEYLSMLEQRYNSLSELSSIYSIRTKLIGHKHLNIDHYQLTLNMTNCLHIAGKLLKEKSIDLSKKPAYLESSFFEEAKKQAIALGAPSPEILAERTIFATELTAARDSEAKLKIQLRTQSTDTAHRCNALHRRVQTIAKISEAQKRAKDKLELQLANISTCNSKLTYDLAAAKLNEAKIEDMLMELRELYKDLVDTLNTKNEEILTIQTKLATENTTVEILENDRLSLQLQLDDATQRTSKLDATIVSIQDNIIDDFSIGDNYSQENILAKLETARNYIFILKSKIDSEHTAKIELQDNVLSLQNQLSEALQHISDMKRTIFTLQETIKRTSAATHVSHEKLQTELEDKCKFILALQSTIDIFKTTNMALQNKVSSLQAQLSASVQQVSLQYDTIISLQEGIQETSEATLHTQEKLKAELQDERRNIVTLQSTISAEEATNQELQAKIAALQRQTEQTPMELITTNTGNAQDIIQPALIHTQELIKKLKSKKEILCGNIIYEKLVPITEDYLRHLLVSAKKYRSNIDTNDFQQILPRSIYTNNMAANSAYEKIKDKYEIIKELYEKLNATDTQPLPSLRIVSFNESLLKHASDIKKRRSPEWTAYCKACLAIVAIIITGIIPGVALLATYSAITKKSPLFFITSGQQYIEDIKRNSPLQLN